MTDESWTSGWERRVREAEVQVQAEVTRAILYLNEQVVPEIRRDGLVAMRTAAKELRRLASVMDGVAGAPRDANR